jgi:hypothetical protein
MINERETAVDRIRMGRGSQISLRKPTPIPFYLSQIQNVTTWDGKRTTAVEPRP